jgi:hypothetical protein
MQFSRPAIQVIIILIIIIIIIIIAVVVVVVVVVIVVVLVVAVVQLYSVRLFGQAKPHNYNILLNIYLIYSMEPSPS